jgi:hypothetical protein
VSAAILSAATIAVAGCGGSGNDNAGAADRQASSSNQSTQSNTQSSSNGSGSSNSSTQSSGSMSQSSFSTDEGTVRLYAGSADATITVDVDGASRLLWSNDKGHAFRLSGTGGTAIDSSDGSGEVPLSGGQHRLEVHGDVWTIVIRPG